MPERLYYNEHLLDVYAYGAGWKVFIYGPGRQDALAETPWTSNRKGREMVINQARAAVDEQTKPKPAPA